jgi:acetyl esterase/lipase
MLINEKLSISLFWLLVVISVPSWAQSPDIKVLHDISYGSDKSQKLDVYIPANAKDAPVIFMVHGGAWRTGDKSAKSVVQHKVKHWVSKGFILISINYRMVPEVYPLRQAKDVETALIFSQQKVSEWGGSSDQFILMGHSAGAHLVSLVAANYKGAQKSPIKPWLATVSLDSAAYDIAEVMRKDKPPRFYKQAFGEHPQYWKKASPFHSLTGKLFPFLAVCSSQRKDGSCEQAKKFIKKAEELGTSVKLLAVTLSHRKVNSELGDNNCYTHYVDDFLQTLHPKIESMLASQRVQAEQNCNDI